jgi:hypothetical protein
MTMIKAKNMNRVLEDLLGKSLTSNLNEEELYFTNDAKGLDAKVISPEDSGEKFWTVLLGMKIGSWRFNKLTAQSKDAAIKMAKDHVK